MDNKSRVLLLHCPDCFYMSHSFPKMCEHFFTHQESVEWQIFRCSICHLICSHEELILEHFISQHSSEDHKPIKQLIIDSLFIPEFPENYSMETEMNPINCYRSSYMCPFCQVSHTDADSFRTHMELIHNTKNIEDLESFLNITDIVSVSNTKINKISRENALNCSLEYKKQNQHVDSNESSTITQPNEQSTLTDKMISQFTKPSQIDPKHKVQLFLPLSSSIDNRNCDPIIMDRDLIRQSYDPEPLRFLRNLVRAGIPMPELIGFSWKGNRRGRPRHLVTTASNQAQSSSTSNQRQSMKDDPRMRAYCQLVQKITGRLLPENLGTHMHQFLSNLRNKGIPAP